MSCPGSKEASQSDDIEKDAENNADGGHGGSLAEEKKP